MNHINHLKTPKRSSVSPKKPSSKSPRRSPKKLTTDSPTRSPKSLHPNP